MDETTDYSIFVGLEGCFPQPGSEVQFFGTDRMAEPVRLTAPPAPPKRTLWQTIKWFLGVGE